jgi:hypothetical protein
LVLLTVVPLLWQSFRDRHTALVNFGRLYRLLGQTNLNLCGICRGREEPSTN